MTFIYELDPYPLKMYPQIKKPTLYVDVSKVIVIGTYIGLYIHTDRQIPPKLLHRFTGGNKLQNLDCTVRLRELLFVASLAR